MKKGLNRRLFIKSSTIGAGMLSSLGLTNLFAGTKEKQLDSVGASDLKIAGYDYPRIKSITNGSVKIENYSYEFVKGGISDLNTMTFSGDQEYDITEIGIVPFINAFANENFRDYYLIPVFPLRVFRHKSIFIRTGGVIEKPEDLKGKRIGTPGYSSSSLTWIRGMLQDEYGVSPKDVNWVISTGDSSGKISGKVSKQENVIPEGISIENGPEGMDESELLLSGNVDALFHAVEPAAYIKGDPRVRRLFADSRSVEQAYFKKTGVFPIMHAVAVKKTVLDKDDKLARTIFNSYSQAKMQNYQFMRKLGWAYDSLPWYSQEYEQTRNVMGNDFWPYGIEKNSKTLQTVCDYCYNQGLIQKKINYEEMFYPGSLTFEES